MEDVSVIAVMGVTGSGKSSFLRQVTGNQTIPVGDDMVSCTVRTERYESTINGRRIIYLDCPGFDDTYRGDADVLADIASALASSYKSDLKVTGVVYLHAIKNEKMTNSLMRNLTMFRKLCGDGGLKNVVLATTFWDQLPDVAIGERREAQLRETYDWWGFMASQGSKIRRSDNTVTGALNIVNEILDISAVALQVQTEMVDRGLEVGQTAAGEALNRELLEQERFYEEQIRQYQEEQTRAERDHDQQLKEYAAQQEKEKLKQLEEIEKERKAMQADRREERHVWEQRWEDMKQQFEFAVRGAQAIKDDVETEAREQRRRMELEHEEEMYKLSRERKRLAKDMEETISQERAEADRRLEECLKQSTAELEKAQEALRNSQVKDRKRFEQHIASIRKEQAAVQEENKKLRRSLEKLNRDIYEARLAQQSASEEEWKGEQARIKKLEEEKKAKKVAFWTRIGAQAAIASVMVAVLAA